MVTGFEPIAGSLAAFALIFPVYDSCNRLHAGCMVLRSFGRDIQLLWKQLDAQWIRLKLIMQRDELSVQNPPDSDNPHHWVTNTIMEQLKIIETYFRDCESLVHKHLRKAGISLDDLQETSSSELPALSSGTLSAETPEASTPLTVSLLTSAEDTGIEEEATASEEQNSQKTGLSKGKKSFGRNLIPRWAKDRKKSKGKDRHQGAKTIANRGRLAEQTVSGAPSREPVIPESVELELMVPVSGSAGQPLRRSQLPIPELQLPEVRQNVETSRQKARAVQKRTGILTHIKWAHHDQETFEKKVTEIRKTVNTLDKLLALRSPSNPGRLLAARSNASSISHSTPQVQGALERLHSSLRNLNVQKPNWNFAVHVATPFDDNWKLIHEQYALPLRKSALIFYVQQQKASEESTFLLMETLTEPAQGAQPQADNVRQIQDLNGPSLTADGNQLEEYKTWGFTCTPQHPEDEHRIFGDTTIWRRTSTLADVLVDPESLKHLSPENVILLARRIMVAHLDFSLVRPSCPNPRLESYVYYERSVEVEGMEDEGPFLLRPYLACGFGRRPPGRQPGATSGPSKDINAPVVELGLVLFQIGSQQKLSYQTKAMGGTAETLSVVKNEALGSLEEVERLYGPVFARVIEVCLLSRAENETEVVENGLTKLIEFQNALTAPIQGHGVQ